MRRAIGWGGMGEGEGARTNHVAGEPTAHHPEDYHGEAEPVLKDRAGDGGGEGGGDGDQRERAGRVAEESRVFLDCWLVGELGDCDTDSRCYSSVGQLMRLLDVLALLEE